MATGTGNLPFPGKDYVPFDILTAEELDQDVANIESLATGTGIGDGAIPRDKIDFSSFGVTDANGWKDYGLFYQKSYNHSSAVSIPANTSIYVDTASSSGLAPVAEGGVYPTGRTIITTGGVGTSVAQAGLVVTTDGTYRGFFVFNGGNTSATWGTRTITITIMKA